MDLTYEDELCVKKQNLLECLGVHSHLLTEVIPSPKPLYYRNKMEFAFGDDKQGGALALGIRKRRSMYEVATVEECVLIHEDFKKIVQITTDYFQNTGDNFYHRKKRTGSLRHLTVRRGEFTGEILIMLSSSSSLNTPLEPLLIYLTKACKNIVGILHSINDGVSDVVKTEDVKILFGRDFYKETLLGLNFEISINAFFQTNSQVAEILYMCILDFAKTVGSNSLALDLYCGTGTIARILSPIFENVVGVDIIPEAIENAQKMAKENCIFFAGDVVKLMKSEDFNNPSLIILDPPRDGLNPKLIPYIAALTPEKIIYVACKPKSLARDIPLFGNHGYIPKKINAVDMFPRTPHIECVALFDRLYTHNGKHLL